MSYEKLTLMNAPLSNTIYLGTANKNGLMSSNRRDFTKEAFMGVAGWFYNALDHTYVVTSKTFAIENEDKDLTIFAAKLTEDERNKVLNYISDIIYKRISKKDN